MKKALIAFALILVSSIALGQAIISPKTQGPAGPTGPTGAGGMGTVSNDTTTNASFFPGFYATNTGAQNPVVSSTKLTFNPSTGYLGTSNIISTSSSGVGITSTTPVAWNAIGTWVDSVPTQTDSSTPQYQNLFQVRNGGVSKPIFWVSPGGVVGFRTLYSNCGGDGTCGHELLYKNMRGDDPFGNADYAAHTFDTYGAYLDGQGMKIIAVKQKNVIKSYLSSEGGIRLGLSNTYSYTCSAGTRGLIEYTQGATNVSDKPQICAKDASNAYAWHRLDHPKGTATITAGTATVTVTNTNVASSSVVQAVLQRADTTCLGIASVVPGAGSFVVNTASNCTANTTVGYVVFN
jgi:hypothetical protein